MRDVGVRDVGVRAGLCLLIMVVVLQRSLLRTSHLACGTARAEQEQQEDTNEHDRHLPIGEARESP